IQGNYVGTDSSATYDLGNSGSGVVLWGTTSGTSIGGTGTGEGNVIAHQTNNGVYLDESAGTGNSILGNRIYDNQLGIELVEAGPVWGVTTNDADDADTGANNLQNFPVITAAATAGSQIEISGTLDTDGLNQDYRIEFFATGTPDGSGYGEAERYLGFATITTDGSGDASFAATIETLVYAGEAVTATATVDNGGGSYGDTSEFAQNFTATTATNEAPTFMPVTANGIVTTDFAASDTGYGMITQSDGKIVVVGKSGNDVALARYNADGTLDTTFGSGGMLTTDIGGTSDVASAVTIQSDNKILVAGKDGTDLALARYNPDGTLDATFGSGGLSTIDVAAGSLIDAAVYVTELSDGRILVAGTGSPGIDHSFAIVRLESNGIADTTFGGGDGILTPQIGERCWAGGATIQPDGKLLITGQLVHLTGPFSSETGVVRFNSDGTQDAVGYVVSGGAGTDVAVQADGKVLVTGNGFLQRYNQDLSLDTTFSGDGRLATSFGGSSESNNSVRVQADGKIIIAGSSDTNFALARYNTDGTLDTDFSGDGLLTTDLGGSDVAYAMSVLDDGKILVAGGDGGDFALICYNADGSLDTTFDTVSTLDNAPSFTEGLAAVVLDANVEIRDAELDALNSGNGNYNGDSVTLVRNGGANAEDVFSATGTLSALTESGNLVVGATTIGTVTTNSAGTLLLTFNTNATTALVNSALQQIAYSNSSDTPPA
ncbi:MAG: hypothetical protein GY792_21000, partial [Gammaproteobacteria bacterium]|nr:hypothetical protein [Gammaproteobacteria bacterium]